MSIRGTRLVVQLICAHRFDPSTRITAARTGGHRSSRDDSAANKVCATFSRGEARDYIDIHAAVSSGLYTRTGLEMLAAGQDPGFSLPVFGQALRASARHGDGEYTVYGLSTDQVSELRSAMRSWADDIESR